MVLYSTETTKKEESSLMYIHKKILVAFAIATTFAGQATAENLPLSPEERCWQQQAAFVDEGLEMPVGPIETGGEIWNIVWESGSEDLIPGDRISVPFEDGVVQLTGTTPAMADHLLTLNLHWAAGREPFAVRYEGTIFMIVPHQDRETGETWCPAWPLN